MNLTPMPSSDSVTCGYCGSTRIATRMETNQFEYGEGPTAIELTAVIPVHTCMDCRAEFTTAAAEDARHDAVCRHLNVLTPSAIQSIRKRHNLSRSEFAKLTRIGEATIARWERGSFIQNAGYDQLLRLLDYEDNIARLAHMSINSEGAPTDIAQFLCLTVNSEYHKEQATFKLRKMA